MACDSYVRRILTMHDKHRTKMEVCFNCGDLPGKHSSHATYKPGEEVHVHDYHTGEYVDTAKVVSYISDDFVKLDREIDFETVLSPVVVCFVSARQLKKHQML